MVTEDEAIKKAARIYLDDALRRAEAKALLEAGVEAEPPPMKAAS